MIKVCPKIKRLGSKFGVEFRIGKTPRDAGIEATIPDDVVACYFNGTGVIFVRDRRIRQMDLDVICLHEIGHAVLDFFKMKIPAKSEEVKANGIALFMAAFMNKPVSRRILNEFTYYARSKK